MRHADARAIFKYWTDAPPENEMLALLAGVYIDWKPASAKPMTEEEASAAHMRSLEQRWASGNAMNAKQLFEAMGGAAGVAMRMDGTLQPAQAINDFPGVH
jgi:hypothetical protein